MAASAAAEGGQRDVTVIGLVAAAHYSSHLMQLALPPLFPILHGVFGVSFVELGLVVTLFYVASGLGQAMAGILVDRLGAHRLLVAGLALEGLSIGLAGLTPAYWPLLPLAVLAGLGNSVFHPADLSILSHRVDQRRLGRAYAAHGIAGSLGYATSPVAVAAIAAVASWRIALLAVGAWAIGVAVLLQVQRSRLLYDLGQDGSAAGEAKAAKACAPGYLAVIGSPVVLLAFGYFILTALAGTGLQTFAITALTTGYGLALDGATLGLTAYLVGSAVGILLGGLLADRTERHHLVAMTGIGLAAALMVVIASFPSLAPAIIVLMMLAGVANGITSPSRDVLIRRAAAGAGMGSVFGFVYSGFDLGSSTAPLLFGALVDHGATRTVFLAVAAAFALAVPTVMQVQHQTVIRRHAAVD